MSYNKLNKIFKEGGMEEKLEEIKKLVGKLQKEVPGEIEGFLNFLQKAEKKSAISAKNKEIINVSLAVAAQCEWCIAFHTKNALKLGASEKELIEAGMQAVVMHGGPALMYMTPLLKSIEEFDHE